MSNNNVTPLWTSLTPSTSTVIPNYFEAQMVMSNTITKIAPALLNAQKNMGNAIKDSKNPFFKSSYANLNAVREACTPALNKEGIMVLQPMIQKEGRSFVRTLLLHESGEFIGSDTEVVCSKQNDAQAYGSATSYARRYGLQALVSLGAEDDDAESSMNRTASHTSEAPKKTSSFKKPVKTEETPEGW